MLNWLSGGVINLNTYSAPVIFAIAITLWVIVLKRYINIRENYRLLIKVAAYSFTGAVISPLIIFTISGELIPFIKKIFGVLGKITDMNVFLNVIGMIFKGFSITGGLTVLAIVLIFFIKDSKKVIFGILYPFPLFAAVTRVNCFMEGCCFGKLYDGKFALTYPPASHASKYHYAKYGLVSRFVESLPVYPSQIILVISMLSLFLVLLVMNVLKTGKNIIIGTMLAGYGLINFIIEFHREEPLVFGTPFTIGQYMEVILIMLGVYVMVKFREI